MAFVIGQAFAANVLTYANWIRNFLKKKKKKGSYKIGLHKSWVFSPYE